MEFVTISNWDLPNATDEIMTEARDKFMPAILATGADNVYMVKPAIRPFPSSRIFRPKRLARLPPRELAQLEKRPQNISA